MKGLHSFRENEYGLQRNSQSSSTAEWRPSGLPFVFQKDLETAGVHTTVDLGPF